MTTTGPFRDIYTLCVFCTIIISCSVIERENLSCVLDRVSFIELLATFNLYYNFWIPTLVTFNNKNGVAFSDDFPDVSNLTSRFGIERSLVQEQDSLFTLLQHVLLLKLGP